jgi:tape measure domain-containing protein
VDVGNLQSTLTLDGDQFFVTVKRAGEVLQTFNGQLKTTQDITGKTEAAHATLSRSFRNFMVTVAATRFALMDFNEIVLGIPRGVMKMSGEMERLMKLMEGLSTATTEAGKRADAVKGFDFITRMAQTAPFQIKAITDSFVKLKSAGIDPLDGMLQGLIDSVAKFGGNSETLQRATVAIQQMAGKGVISMEELRQQLGEAVPNAMQMMATGLGMSMAELSKAVSKGTVQAQGALERFKLVLLAENEGAARAMMDTWTGMQAQLATQMTLLGKTVGDAGFFQAVKQQMGDLNSFLHSGAASGLAQDLGRGLAKATIAIAEAIRTLIEFRTAIINTAEILGATYLATKFGAMFESWRVNAAATITAMTANNAKIIAAQQQLVAEQTAIDVAAQEAKIARNVQEISRKQAEYATLIALEERYQAQITAIRQAGIAAARAQGSAALLGGVAGGGASAAAAQAQLMQVSAMAAARKAEMAAIDASNIALRANATQIAASGEAALAQAGKIGIAARAAGLFGAAVTALGGPLSALTIALTVGITLWQLFGNKGKEAIDKINAAARNGTGDREALSLVTKQIEDLQKKIATRQKDVDDIGAQGDGGSSQQRQRIAKQSAAAQAELDGYKAQLTDMMNKRTKIRSDLQNQEVERGRSIIDAGVQKDLDNIVKAKAAERDAITQKMLALEKDPKYATDKSLQKQVDDLGKAKGKVDIAQFDAEAQLLEARVKQMDDKIAAGLIDGDSKVTQGARAQLTKLAQEKRELAARAGQIIGTPSFAPAKDPKPHVPKEDPLYKMVKQTEDALEQAKAELDIAEDGAVNFWALYNKAADHIEKLRQEGKFNYKDDDKVVHDRKAGLTADEKNALQEATYNEAIAEADKRNKQGMAAATRALTGENDDLRASQERLDGATGKIDGTFEKTTRQFDLLKMGMVEGTAAFDEFLQKMTRAQNIAAKTDLNNFLAQMLEENKKLQLDAVVDDRDRNTLEYNQFVALQRAKFAEISKNLQAMGPMTIEMQAEMDRAASALADNIGYATTALVKKNRTALQMLLDDWKNTTNAIEGLQAKWADDWVETIMTATTEGKLDWKKMVESMLADILRLQLRSNVAQTGGSIFQLIGSWVGKLFSGGGGLGAPGGPSFGSDGGGIPSFAMGGVMGSGGSLPLQRYATGGVANSPQLALFGEGRGPEAYVPLPDGRSIPVSMRGGDAPTVVVNVINQSGQNVQAEQKGGPRMDGERMILDVVLSAAGKPGGFRDGMRGALR